MKKELNNRQWALYNYLKMRGDRWTTQLSVARALAQHYGYIISYANFHDSAARHTMTADIRTINESGIIQKIIISSGKGIKLANEEEFSAYIGKEITAAVARLQRAKRKAAKGNRDGQMRIVLGAERDTVKAFIDSDKAFGQRLKQYRIDNKLLLETVSARLKSCGLNVDVPMLSRFENGYCLPTKSTLLMLAEIYGVSYEELTNEGCLS